MPLKTNAILLNIMMFILLIITSLLSYLLCQLTKFPYLYLNLPILVILNKKVHIPLVTIILISLFDEQMLNFPIGMLVAINTGIMLLYKIILHKHKMLCY